MSFGAGFGAEDDAHGAGGDDQQPLLQVRRRDQALPPLQNGHGLSAERDLFIDNLLVRVHYIMVMIM